MSDQQHQSPEQAATLDRIIDALRNDVRRSLLIALVDDDKDVSTLTDEVGMHISVISHNLRTLRELGLVVVHRDSRRRIYRLTSAVRVDRDGGTITLTIPTAEGGRVSVTFPPDGRKAGRA